MRTRRSVARQIRVHAMWSPVASPRRLAPRGACRFVCEQLHAYFPNLGFRRSHIGMLLFRYTVGPVAERRHLAKASARSTLRMTPVQLLIAARLTVRWRLSSSVLASTLAQLQKPRCAIVFQSFPKSVTALVQEMAQASTDMRDTGVVGFVQYVAARLAEHGEAYGACGLQVLCCLAQSGGSQTLRRFSAEDASQLVAAVCDKAGLQHNPVIGFNGDVSAKDAADLFCSLSRMGHRDAALVASLGRHIADRIEDVDVLQLPVLARALSRAEPPFDDFVLLHGIARRSSSVLGDLDGSSVIALLQVLGRYELYDEEFLEAAFAHLQESAVMPSAGSLGCAIAALGSLKASDASQLDALCAALTPKVHDLGEADLVRCMRGLLRLRHCNQELLQALEPVIEKHKWSYSSISLSNIVSVLSFFGVTSEMFFKSLLHTVSSRNHRLSSTSLQHILTSLTRQQGRIPLISLLEPLKMACKHLTTPAVILQLTPVQAIGSLAALSKLKCRDLAACSVILSVLVGQASQVVWTWAPSPQFYALRAVPAIPFDEDRCRQLLGRALDSSHYVEILHCIQRLELHSALTLHLAALLCKLLIPHLHELRAKEVLIVTRSLGACHLPGLDGTVDISGGGAADGMQVASWRECLVESGLEGLRRHEHYLEGSWYTLLPFKLLCMEIDSGTFGSRQLSEVLNPRLLSFAERLRLLSRESCELNRLRALAAADEDDSPAGAATPVRSQTADEEDACEGTAVTPTLDAPLVVEMSYHRVISPGCVGMVPVDILIESQ